MANTTESTLIQGHEYDGIKEYDNPTPSWWHALWLGSMVFSVCYFTISLISPFYVSAEDRLAAAEQAEIERLFADIGDLENNEQTLVSLMGDEKWMTFGEAVFRGNCVSCHEADAKGKVGPNLRDEYYKNVKSITDIHKVIVEGAAAGAMPAWGKRMHPNEVVLLSAYIATLRGTATDGKAPEGEQIPPWPTSEELGLDDSPGEG